MRYATGMTCKVHLERHAPAGKRLHEPSHSSNALGRAIMSPLTPGAIRFILDHEVILVSTPSRGQVSGQFSVSKDSWGLPDGAGKASSRIS